MKVKLSVSQRLYIARVSRGAVRLFPSDSDNCESPCSISGSSVSRRPVAIIIPRGCRNPARNSQAESRERKLEYAAKKAEGLARARAREFTFHSVPLERIRAANVKAGRVKG